MEGVYVFVVSVIWICVASMSETEQYRNYMCKVCACNGQIDVEADGDLPNCECLTEDGGHCVELVLDSSTCGDLETEQYRNYMCKVCACNGQIDVEADGDPPNCECLTEDGGHCVELVLDSSTCGDLVNTDGHGLCLDYDEDIIPCRCTDSGLYCCTSDTRLNCSILHFNCRRGHLGFTNAPGATTNASGTPRNAPGTPTNAPGTPTNAPGAPTNAPGTPTKAPGTPTKAPGIPTNAPGAPINKHGASRDKHGASQKTGTLVGGVVGGLIGGVIITAVVVLLWRVCRKRRRHQESPGEQMTDTHAYLGPGHTSDSQDKNKGANEKSSSVPDVVKTSVGSDTGECAIISESGDQGDYTEITDDITGAAGGGTVTTASHGMNPQGGRTPQHAADKPDGEYNTLGDATVTKADAKHTYDRLGDTNPDKARLRHTGNNGSGVDYFVLGESEDNYNRLRHGATTITTGVNSEYNRFGDTTEAGNSDLTDTDALSLDYFVLEEPADTYNKLGVDGDATTTNTKNTYDRLGNTDVDTRPRDSEPSEILLKKSGDTYTKLGEKPSADEVEHTYNKLGGATHKREPDVPPNGTQGPSS